MYDYQIAHVWLLHNVCIYIYIVIWICSMRLRLIHIQSIWHFLQRIYIRKTPHVWLSVWLVAAWAFRSGPMAVSKANDSLIWNGPAKLGPKTSYAWGEKAPISRIRTLCWLPIYKVLYIIVFLTPFKTGRGPSCCGASAKFNNEHLLLFKANLFGGLLFFQGIATK